MAMNGPTCDICGEMIVGTKIAKSKRTGKVMHMECAQQQQQQQQQAKQAQQAQQAQQAPPQQPPGQAQEGMRRQRRTTPRAGGGTSSGGGGGGGGSAVRPECSICGEAIMESKFLSKANGDHMHKACYQKQTAANRKTCGSCGKTIQGSFVTGPILGAAGGLMQPFCNKDCFQDSQFQRAKQGL